MQKNITILSALLLSVAVLGQIGVNTPDPKATLDIAASPSDLTKVDGVLAPRLTGNQLKAKDGLYLAAQTGSIVYVTAAAVPTTTKTVNITTGGYYYFDGAVWQKLANGAAAEPWNVEGTTSPATANSENIYQTGNVAIGTPYPTTGVSLDVRGAVHLGSGHSASATIGLHSLVSGSNNIAETEFSAILGGSGNKTIKNPNSSNAVRSNFIIGGTSNESQAQGAGVIGGIYNKAIGAHSIVLGGSFNETLNAHSVAAGTSNTANGYSEFVAGMFSTNYTYTSLVGDEGKNRLFNIGKGNSVSRADAFTILGHGKVGIGFNNFETRYTGELLQVNGNAQLVSLPTQGANIATDKVVMVDNTGVLKSVATASLIPSNPDAWFYTGNTATATYFLGTLNDVPLTFKINNQHAGQITNENASYGHTALRSNTTGVYNNAFGKSALSANTTGFGNHAFGRDALTTNTTGEFNNAFGYKALSSNTTAHYNNAFGNNTLAVNTTGWRNSAFGQYALASNTVGNTNSGFGDGALSYNTTGSYNTAMGGGSLAYSTGNNNTAIGYDSGPVGSQVNLSTISNSTAIGYRAKVQTSNSMVLGASNSPDEINVGINTTAPQAKLHIIKNASQLTPAIIEGCNVYADNAAATAAGLPVGALYRTAIGVLMVRY